MGRSFWAPGPSKLTFLNPKGVYSYLFYPWDKMVCSKNPYFTHLAKKRFFGTPCMYVCRKTLEQIIRFD